MGLSYNAHKITLAAFPNVNLSPAKGDFFCWHFEDFVKKQIYLSLRLAIMNEISKEKLPVILDEAFAYYDDQRLEAALDFLSKIDNQVILFTCTNREKEILNKNNIDFNFITL